RSSTLFPYTTLFRSKGDVDAIIGCPPCQGFSSLGRTKHVEGSRDRRNSLVQVFVDRIKEIRPRVVIFENVPGMMKGPHRRYYSLDRKSTRLNSSHVS